MSDGGQFVPDVVIEKMSATFLMSNELYRDTFGPPWPWTVAEWEEKSAWMVRDAQPWRRLRVWILAGWWTMRRRLAERVYPPAFPVSDEDEW